MKNPGKTLALAAAMAMMAHFAHATDLRIGLQEDPDVLDPDQSRTFVGRIVYASMCDKLVDITPDLKIVPMLATGWKWSDDGKALTMTLRDGVTFQDGTPFDAEAVKYNIERSKTFELSRRKSEVKSIESVDVVDPHTVTFNLAAPDATLLAQFADRSGMMLSPTAAEKEGADFGLHPVCAGPFKFAERVQQDKIVLEKYDGYYDADKIHFDKVIFRPIPDTTVRLANLRAGDLDMIERLAPTDLASVKADDKLATASAVSIGYQGITINTANTDRAKNPLGESKLVRQALSLAIDRDALNQVVFNGAFAPGNQPFPPTSPWYDKDFPLQPRDVEKAKALLKEAGYDKVSVEMQTSPSPQTQQVAQVIQAMAAEAGIDIKIVTKEFATMLKDQTAGDFQSTQVGWSGRVDPDGNIYGFVVTGAGLNDGHYSNPEVDKALSDARLSTDPETRKKSYDAAQAILMDELPIIYLYHPVWLWAYSAKLKGYTPYADGMIRLQNVSLEN
ncbi:ABC transporter substrate-binding protein [Thioclava atlantica]|uniref:ABC transporter substrate binding protein (Dipeptide) n=1 Tax=Thioclava atlantica TaxID=1317124 RepID=A0A085TW30_9RHOB|nr:ABC transporter substrate-binding protein [Thioclava atlantica]KFE34927.1 ABC transporter substrate binding protein (dipeptide) [Thioclava atlantica]